MAHCSHIVITNLIQNEVRETEILRNFSRLRVKLYISIRFRDLFSSLSLPNPLQSQIRSLLFYYPVGQDLS